MMNVLDDIANRPFCPDYSRFTPEGSTAPFKEEGYIMFPRDVERRRQYFCPDSMKHPAKANIYMVERLVNLVSPWPGGAGDTLLDPMSGTGTLMMATLAPTGGWSGRSVILIEDSAIFHYYQQQSREMFLKRGVPDYAITLLHGGCQDFLPLPVDHIIFSPPYSSVMNFKVKADSTAFLAGGTYGGYTGDRVEERNDQNVFEDYLGTEKNFGRLNQFMYNQKISIEYGKMIQGLRPGGTLTVIVQDLMQGGKRVKLSEWVMRTCVRQGAELLRWECRYAPGTGFKRERKSKGYEVVENEDLIILRKPA